MIVLSSASLSRAVSCQKIFRLFTAESLQSLLWQTSEPVPRLPLSYLRVLSSAKRRAPSRVLLLLQEILLQAIHKRIRWQIRRRRLRGPRHRVRMPARSYAFPSTHATAPQLWRFVEWTSRRVVATTLTFGYFFTTASIMPIKALGSSFDFARDLRTREFRVLFEDLLHFRRERRYFLRFVPQPLPLFSVRPRCSRASRGSSGRS